MKLSMGGNSDSGEIKRAASFDTVEMSKFIEEQTKVIWSSSKYMQQMTTS